MEKYVYINEGIEHELTATTLEAAEEEARAYTHDGWDAYLEAPESIRYAVFVRENGGKSGSGERLDYSEVCGPMAKEAVCDYIREYSEECVRAHYDRPEGEQVSSANGEWWDDVLTARIEGGRIMVSDGTDTRDYERDGGKLTRESAKKYVDDWLYIVCEPEEDS